MASENVKVFTDGNFSADVLQSPRPVLVDFWAEWCGPCKRIAPTVDQLASDFNGRVDIGKLNVDDNPRTPAQYLGARHPDAADLQGRPGGRLGRRRAVHAGSALVVDREASVNHDVLPVVIVGSGPAGLTAALYTARANLHPLVIEGLDAGGQLMITTMVDNWPGYREGIMGPDLMDEMRAQAQKFGAKIISGRVVSVDLAHRPFHIKTDEHDYRAQSLIIATGASARWLGLPSERKLVGRGVSSCATCDGAFFKQRPVAIVGGGDTAMEEALFLTRFASKVMVLHRRETLRASRIMQDKALANPKIEFVWNVEVVDIKDAEKGEVTGVTLRHVQTGELTELPVDGVFVAIGHEPNTALFKGKLDLHPNGYIVTSGTKTSVEGVFACGDVQDFTYRQAVTAAGSGCMAAIDAERFLEHAAHLEKHAAHAEK